MLALGWLALLLLNLGGEGDGVVWAGVDADGAWVGVTLVLCENCLSFFVP